MPLTETNRTESIAHLFWYNRCDLCDNYVDLTVRLRGLTPLECIYIERMFSSKCLNHKLVKTFIVLLRCLEHGIFFKLSLKSMDIFSV